MTVQIEQALQRFQLVTNFLNEADQEAINLLLQALGREPVTEAVQAVQAVRPQSIVPGPQARGEVRDRLQEILSTLPIEQVFSVNQCLSLLKTDGFHFRSSHPGQPKNLVRKSLRTLVDRRFLKIVDKGGGGRPVRYRRIPVKEESA